MDLCAALTHVVGDTLAVHFFLCSIFWAHLQGTSVDCAWVIEKPLNCISRRRTLRCAIQKCMSVIPIDLSSWTLYSMPC